MTDTKTIYTKLLEKRLKINLKEIYSVWCVVLILICCTLTTLIQMNENATSYLNALHAHIAGIKRMHLKCAFNVIITILHVCWTTKTFENSRINIISSEKSQF